MRPRAACCPLAACSSALKWKNNAFIFPVIIKISFFVLLATAMISCTYIVNLQNVKLISRKSFLWSTAIYNIAPETIWYKVCTAYELRTLNFLEGIRCERTLSCGVAASYRERSQSFARIFIWDVRWTNCNWNKILFYIFVYSFIEVPPKTP